jgi:hypothetical protein
MSKFSSLGLAVDTPARLILRHPSTRQPIRDKDGKEAYIELLSSDSVAARDHELETQNQRLKSGVPRTAEQIEADTIELLVRLTKDWYLVHYDGTPVDVKFTEADARELYSVRSTAWIARQVRDFLDNQGNFFKASSTS